MDFVFFIFGFSFSCWFILIESIFAKNSTKRNEIKLRKKKWLNKCLEIEVSKKNISFFFSSIIGLKEEEEVEEKK